MCNFPTKCCEICMESLRGNASSGRPTCSFHPLRPTDSDRVFLPACEDTTRHLFRKEAKNQAFLQKFVNSVLNIGAVWTSFFFFCVNTFRCENFCKHVSV